MILEYAMRKFDHLTIYQPVVNGIGGNLVALFASRLGTVLYRSEVPGKWAEWAPSKWFQFPLDAFLARKSTCADKRVFLYFVFFFLKKTH